MDLILWRFLVEKERWLIVGLGNVGDKYLRTRHNLGFMAIEVLCQIWKIKLDKIKFKGLYNKGDFVSLENNVQRKYQIKPYGRKKLPELRDIDLIVLKPSTFMNNSGLSVKEAMDFYKIPSERLIVIYDDFDLNVGSIRIRAKGSAGTHNGMRSIISNIKTENFIRIRIGCGPLNRGEDIISFVMRDIPKSEQEATFESFELAAKAVRLILLGGVEFALNFINAERQSL